MKAKATGSPIRQARLELPDKDYCRLKKTAARWGLGVATYVRLVVLKSLERDERGAGLDRKISGI